MIISLKPLKLSSVFLCMLMCGLPPSAYAQNVSEPAKGVSPVAEPDTVSELLALYPSGSIQTLEAAKRVGEDVRRVRSSIEKKFTVEQSACYPKFFATACLSEVKEHHRIDMGQVRLIEIEANKFKRRASAQDRDKALAEKHDKEKVDTVSSAKENSASVIEKAGPVVAQERSASTAVPDKSENASAKKRSAVHLAAIKKKQAADGEREKQNAGNIATHEKKVQESEARQREIAAKKLEKEQALKSKSPADAK